MNRRHRRTTFWKAQTATHMGGKAFAPQETAARNQVAGKTLSGGTEILRFTALRHLLQGPLTNENDDIVGTSAKFISCHKSFRV